MPSPAGGRDALALGITEPNPAFLVAGGPPEFEALARRPRRHPPVATTGSWSTGPRSPRPTAAGIDLAKPQHGCMRDLGPCAPFAGVRAQLEALAAAQRAEPGPLHRHGGLHRHARRRSPAPPHGCERDDVLAALAPAATRRARRLPPGGPRRARRGGRAGADVPYWSPWNEPNHPYFLSPQRARCSAAAPLARPRAVRRLARAMLAELDAAPGEQRLVLGETAGLFEPQVHDHARPRLRARRSRAGSSAAPRSTASTATSTARTPSRAVARALDAFGCPRPPRIWITETGIKDASAAAPAEAVPAARWCAGGATRASTPPSSTRCARTTASRPAWSPPTSPAPTACSASGRRGARGPATARAAAAASVVQRGQQPERQGREADHDPEHPVLRPHGLARVPVERERAVVGEHERRHVAAR